MAHLAVFDYIILGILGLSSLISLFRGFVKEALSLLVWLAAVWIAWYFFRDLAPRFTPWIETPSIRLALAFAGLVLVTLVVGGMLTWLIAKLIESTGLSGMDRLIGMVFGFARGLLLVTVLVVGASLTPFAQDPWWRQSHFVPYFEELAVWIHAWLPENVQNLLPLPGEAKPAPVLPEIELTPKETDARPA